VTTEQQYGLLERLIRGLGLEVRGVKTEQAKMNTVLIKHDDALYEEPDGIIALLKEFKEVLPLLRSFSKWAKRGTWVLGIAIAAAVTAFINQQFRTDPLEVYQSVLAQFAETQVVIDNQQQAIAKTQIDLSQVTEENARQAEAAKKAAQDALVASRKLEKKVIALPKVEPPPPKAEPRKKPNRTLGDWWRGR